MAKGDWRDALDRKMFKILKDRGMNDFLATATAALSVNAGGQGMVKAQYSGEICEIVLMGMSQAYIQAEGREAQVYHSVVLKDLNNPKSDFRTELDFVMVSPGFVLTSECKSYSGEVSITEDCTLTNRNSSVNIYTQSRLHYNHLKLYVQQAIKPGVGLQRFPTLANAFLFSNAKVSDRRTAEAKKKIFVGTASTVYDYYDLLFKKYSTPVLDYEKLCKVFGMASRSKKLHNEHGKFVGYKD